MAQFQEFVTSPTLARRPAQIGRLQAIFLGTIILLSTLATIGLVMSMDAAPRTVTTQASTDVTDGWMPAISYANRERTAERARATVDGWAPALLKPEPPVVDGWASRYLVSDD